MKFRPVERLGVLCANPVMRFGFGFCNPETNPEPLRSAAGVLSSLPSLKDAALF
jgi:hypothetical protein